MCEDNNHQRVGPRPDVNRRRLLKLGTASALGLGLVGIGVKTTLASDGRRSPPLPENVLSADAAFERLMEGNARYVAGQSTPSISMLTARPW